MTDENGTQPTDPNRPVAGIVFLLLADGNVVSRSLNEQEVHRNLTMIELRGICDWFRGHLDAQELVATMNKQSQRLTLPGGRR